MEWMYVMVYYGFALASAAYTIAKVNEDAYKFGDVIMVDRPRLMPVFVDGGALVVRPEPATASGIPLDHAEKTLHAMADRIEALEARQVKLVAVVEAARINNKITRDVAVLKALAALDGGGDG